jgi:tetratricopeptide (TPR) repeat protein
LFLLCVCLQTGDEFVAAADGYVRRFISRGIPSLFSDLKPLYADPAKAAALQSLFEGYAAHLRQQGTMPPLKQGSSSGSSANGTNSSSSTNGPAAANGTSSSNGGSSSGEDNPLTWVLHYLSQHYDRLGQTAAALEASAAALGLAPEVIELLLARAKILKHAGDVVGSAVAADAARRSDLADRYTNSMAVKALFAAGLMELAEQTALLFTRDGDQVSCACNCSWGQLPEFAAVGCGSVCLLSMRAGNVLAGLPGLLCVSVSKSLPALLLLLRTMLPCLLLCVSQLNNLYDMQHMWYEVRSGDAYMAAGQLPKALKKYTSVAKHFSGSHGPDLRLVRRAVLYGMGLILSRLCFVVWYCNLC